MKDKAHSQGNDRFADVKSGDALGDLAKRDSSKQAAAVFIIIVGVLVLAFIGGLLFRNLTGDTNKPEIPSVEI